MTFATAQRLALFVSLLFLIAPSAFAQAPVQLQIAGNQMPEDPNVDGARIGILYAKSDNVSGFDLGLLSFNEAKNTSGVSMIWGLGKVTGRSSGLASSFINLHSGEDTGANAAFINAIRTLKSGVNIGFVNVTSEHSSVDVSGVGISDSSNVQVGFVNITQRIDGVQIGFLNFAKNGIFPVFPFFNIPKN